MYSIDASSSIRRAHLSLGVDAALPVAGRSATAARERRRTSLATDLAVKTAESDFAAANGAGGVRATVDATQGTAES